jgi:hypothetical protein
MEVVNLLVAISPKTRCSGSVKKNYDAVVFLVASTVLLRTCGCKYKLSCLDLDLIASTWQALFCPYRHSFYAHYPQTSRHPDGGCSPCCRQILTCANFFRRSTTVASTKPNFFSGYDEGTAMMPVVRYKRGLQKSDKHPSLPWTKTDTRLASPTTAITGDARGCLPVAVRRPPSRNIPLCHRKHEDK